MLRFRSMLIFPASIIFASLTLGCSGSSGGAVANSSNAAVEDSSASGAAASSVGGTIGSSSSSGTVSLLEKPAPRLRTLWLSPLIAASAQAANPSCPKLSSTAGSGANSCAATSNVATLSYSACSFGSSAATWTGFMDVLFTGSTTLSCGAFPNPASDTMIRQWVNSAGTNPASGTRTSAAGSAVTMDDTTSGIQGNYQSDMFNSMGASGLTLTPFGVGSKGGGKEITFTSGKRTGVTVFEHLTAVKNSATIWDHTVAGSVTLSETGTGASATWSVSSGTVSSGACTSSGTIVYHNLAKVMGRSCFQAVTYGTGCCTPTSGTITTTFSTTSASGSGALATAMNGKTETLTFNSCGSATFTNYAGVTSTVSMSSCL